MDSFGCVHKELNHISSLSLSHFIQRETADPTHFDARLPLLQKQVIVAL